MFSWGDVIPQGERQWTSEPRSQTSTRDFQAGEPLVLEAADLRNLDDNDSNDADSCFSFSVVKNPSAPGGLTLPTFKSGVNLRGITDGIRANWNPASGATRYELYRSTSSGSWGTRIYRGSALSYEDTGLSSGTTYYYRVKACNSAGCVNGRQDFYTYTAPATTIEIVSFTPSPTGGISVGDNVDFKVSLNDKAARVTIQYGPRLRHNLMSSNTGKTSWTHTRKFESAGTKTVTVRVYDQVSGGNPLVSRTLSVEVSEPTPTLPTFDSGVSLNLITGGIRARWNPASGATRYELYRSTSSGGRATRIYRGSALSYEDTGLSSGTTYYYRVKACNSAGCVDGRQDYFTYPALPTFNSGVSLSPMTGGIRTRWNPASGATRYELYRSTSRGSWGTRIYRGSALSYRDTGLSSGTTYYYRAKACNSAGCVNGRQNYFTYTAR